MRDDYTQHPQEIISGLRKRLIRLRIRLHLAGVILRSYRNPLVCLKILRTLAHHQKEFLGKKISKVARVDGKYYWNLYVPGYSTKSLNHFFEQEANRIIPMGKKTIRFNNVLIAITKRCPLKCEHCFEWESLNKPESLMISDIKSIIDRFQEMGVGQFQLTGGEPLLIVDGIIELLKLKSSKSGAEFWIFTSGYNLTLENAIKLKAAGLTGVFISLDHFDSTMHNRFRGYDKSFEWVQNAVRNSIEAKLVTALSLCVTKSFVSESNLMNYANLAKRMGVSFIQLLEPKAVGHYAGKDVTLDADHEKILEDFYLKINYDKQYREYPIICYHGYYQRKVGCFGSGNRSLYVDADGDIHACPFCRAKMGNALSPDFDRAVERLKDKGCHRYKTSAF